VNFPGGAAAFTETGGLVCEVPFEENGILLYHPNIPKEFEEKITDYNERYHMPGAVKIYIVHDYNFKGMESSEIAEKITEVVDIIGARFKVSMILVSLANPLVLNVLVPSSVLTNEEIKDICDTFRSHIPNLIRGILTLSDGRKFPFSDEETYLVRNEEVKSTEPDRGVITDDAITDLKIALSGDLDVNDIIERL
jgi:hypothetical protein